MLVAISIAVPDQAVDITICVIPHGRGDMLSRRCPAVYARLMQRKKFNFRKLFVRVVNLCMDGWARDCGTYKRVSESLVTAFLTTFLA